MNDHGDDDGRLKFMEYDGHYSRYDIWGGPCPPGENHLIHPAFAKLFIDDDKQIILFTKKWLVFVEANDTIRIINTDDTDAKETNLVVNALQHPMDERNRLAIKVMGCDDDTFLRLKMFLGGE